ncbi:MAG: NADH-quinone oxidoreductase subunit NuoF [Candidatus Riflebacteria bacterium]|nr:NADH-quinone oxidoreductase subunit NuoF [Candidatus Riflebacteria bacterium]
MKAGRENNDAVDKIRTHILVCTGGGCIASGALELSTALRENLKKFGLDRETRVVETGCLGPCSVGPVAVVYPDGVFYQNIKAEDAAEVVEKHILKGRMVERLVSKEHNGKSLPRIEEIDFFRRQEKIVLRNCGMIDPMRIEEYIARDGYQALAQALTKMTPDQVVEEVKKSGLRGRGGAGFSTGLKWSITKKAPGNEKFVLCNGDEGDPGAFMDRSVLEGDPHSVIEGMAIAAYAIGAKQGYAYVRAEYPLAIERMEHALVQAREMGLLGENIMGTGFCFDLEIRMGSGAFVCGEETALMTSIEGNRGEPRPRPPFPAIKGLWGKPSLLNNVETYANIAPIITKGAEWYASRGTEKSRGTKVFALAGSVDKPGLVEVPIGVQLGEVIFDIGGGIPNGKKFKAAQIGGPSGGCIPKEHLNVPVDYESLNELGAIMGSGGLIVMDEDACMVDVARFFLEFVQDESCGKCPPCRVGTKRMLEIVTRICEGKGEEGDIEKLIEIGQSIKDTSLCGLGQSAPNPVLSTIRHFRHEYEAHIREKHCEAGVCPALVRAPCQNACPAGVNVPAFVSLVGEKRYAEALRSHRENNPFASVCSRVCFHPCEGKCRRSTLDESVSIRAVKRFMTEQEVTLQIPEVIENAENAKRKIAIIGGGPSGLSCAYFLARLGYRPKVLEAKEKAGGMLVQAIPEYRLPREELEREVRMIERLGVTIETEKSLGRDFSLESLRKDGYEAIFLSVGCPQGVSLGIPGDKAEGVIESLDFLRGYNLTGKASVGKRVVVIGGGNAAIDAARTSLRLGAEKVTIVYRRTRAQMPAWEEEILAAEEEGIELLTLVTPEEVLIQNGKVRGLKCRHQVLGDYDKSGRRKAVAGNVPDFAVDCDQVIAAIGQKVEPATLLGSIKVTTDRDGRPSYDSMTGKTSEPWLFVGGDFASGPSSVVDAVAAGEKAAVGIDMQLTGANHAFWRRYSEVDTHFDPDADPAPYPRAEIPLLSPKQRLTNFQEVEQSWSVPIALREAKRCLRCDFGKNCETESRRN